MQKIISQKRNNSKAFCLPDIYVTENQFLQRLKSFSSLGNSVKIKQALKLAKLVHSKQKRRGGDNAYTGHIIPCAYFILLHEDIRKESGTLLEDLLTTAILHDVYEDSKHTKFTFSSSASRDVISLSKLFGDQISKNVFLLSDNTLNIPEATPKEQRLQLYFQRLRSSDFPVKLVKCADRLVNMTSDVALLTSGKLPDFVSRYLGETKVFCKSLFEDVGRENPYYLFAFQNIVLRLDDLLLNSRT